MGLPTKEVFQRFYSFNFDKELQRYKSQTIISKTKVVLYIDEFTRYLDITVGKDAIALLTRLGYDVELYYAGKR